jgi:hypothetical protein
MVTGMYPGLTLPRVPGHEVVDRIPRIWAVGDVKGGPAFTHISYDDYPIVAGNLLEGKNLGTDGRVVPSVCRVYRPSTGACWSDRPRGEPATDHGRHDSHDGVARAIERDGVLSTSNRKPPVSGGYRRSVEILSHSAGVEVIPAKWVDVRAHERSDMAQRFVLNLVSFGPRIQGGVCVRAAWCPDRHR